MNELIIVKQLPIIEENLLALKQEIEEKADRAIHLVCTEDTVKEIKVVRTDLNKEFAELETQRKFVKDQVMKPYEAFELVYKDCVSEIYKKADKELKTKIDEVEDGLKKEKENKITEYFNEYLQSKGIDFVTYDKASIKVSMSDSLKSLKDKAKAFIDKICEDIDLIKTQQYADEIMVEYENTLNVSTAVTTVSNRRKALELKKEQEAARIEAQAKTVEAVKQIDKIVELAAPVAKPVEILVKEKQYKATFEVQGTLDELKAVKAFLENGGYKYDSK